MADREAADTLLDRMPAATILHGDKGYDTNAVRRKIEIKGAAPNIPPKLNRRGRTASRPGPTAAAMPSSACSGASRTSAGSRPATTGWPKTTWPPSASPLPSATGYESQP